MKLFNWLPSLLLAAAVFAAEAPTELKIETTFKPEDCTVTSTREDKLEVHYTGKLFDTGAKFDSSHDRNRPLQLTLGVGQVIRGWDAGLAGMCVNEKRILTIPSDMAYGSRGAGGVIPPNAALVFDVELVSLEKGNGNREEL